MKPNIFLRVDGSAEIGLGHVIRCMALGQMLIENFSVTVVAQQIPEKIISELKIAQLNLLRIKNEETFLRTINSHDVVVLDGYHFNLDYQKAIKTTGAKLVCIDDLHEDYFLADLVINHAPDVSPKNYRTVNYTRFALGLDYVLLRPPFLRAAAKLKREPKKLTSVLICFGGSDIKDLTIRAARIVLEFKQFVKIIVVTGSAYQKQDEITKLIKADERIAHYHALNDEEMLELMLQADVAIVPASGVLLEALAVGCRIISGLYVDNQRLLYEKFRKLEFFIDAATFEVEKLHDALTRAFQSDLPKVIIDGKSGIRLRRIFIEMLTSLREIQEDDCLLLFNWANNPAVRQNSILTEPIKWENHVLWFKGKLKSLNTKIFILEFNAIPVGQIRFDRESECWFIDYSVDQEYRGMGLGRLLLTKTLCLFKNARLRAIVKPENTASLKVFSSLDFHILNRDPLQERGNIIFELET